ncbi:MAG: DsrE family protein [Desulfobacterales bacterium]|nr:DsrE family protein [Desulfobacterales bacterium]
MKKVALFAFNGEAMCFVHVMLYALDFHKKDYDIKLIIEGTATKLIKDLADPEAPFSKLYNEIKEKGLIDSVCKACSSKMGTLDDAETQGLTINDELMGHPSMEKYMDAGYEILTF